MAAPQEFAARAATAQAEDRNFEAEASIQLREIRNTANQLALDAGILESYTRGDLSRQSHAGQLNRVRKHVNTIGEQLARIEAIRPMMAPWQQRAVDSIVPAAASLAVSVEGAITHLNDGGSGVWHPNYAERLRIISDRSDRVKNTVYLHLAMADAADRLDELTQRAAELAS